MRRWWKVPSQPACSPRPAPTSRRWRKPPRRHAMPASSDPPANDADLPLSAPVGTQGLAPEADEGLPVTLTVSLPAAVALHARPAADLVRAASKLQATVSVAANGKRANARSILEVLALGAVG